MFCLGDFVVVIRGLPGRVFAAEFGLHSAAGWKVSYTLLALGRLSCGRRICVVGFADGDTGEGFASSALPMAIRARGDEDETPLPVTVASQY